MECQNALDHHWSKTGGMLALQARVTRNIRAEHFDLGMKLVFEPLVKILVK